MICVGLDIGATSIKGALTDAGNRVITKETRPTRSDEALPASLHEIHSCISALTAYSPSGIQGIGIGVPGAVDQQRGIVNQPPNMPAWERVPLADILREQWKCDVRIDNDANCAALGEAHFGAGRDISTFVGLTLGTGVGSGIIINRHIYHGEHGFAGEFGHITIDMNGPGCNCGNRGCIEAYIGIQHLMREALPVLRANRSSALHAAAMERPDELSPRDIGEAASRGDESCVQILDTAGERLGVAVAAAANLLDIGTFIIGGGIAGAGKALFDGIRRSAGERVLQIHRDRLAILDAQLGNDAGMLGASTLLLD
jgi:glucokinase